MARGKVYNQARASQLRDFSRLRYAGNITPTDVDCLIEFGDEAYVIVEAKSNGKPVPMGQRLALQRMIRDFMLRGKKAILIVATHEMPIDEAIDFANCKAQEYFEGEHWARQKRGWAVKRLVDDWLEHNGLDKYLMGVS